MEGLGDEGAMQVDEGPQGQGGFDQASSSASSDNIDILKGQLVEGEGSSGSASLSSFVEIGESSTSGSTSCSGSMNKLEDKEMTSEEGEIRRKLVGGMQVDGLLDRYVTLQNRTATLELENRNLQLQNEALENQRQHAAALSFAEFRYKEEAYRQILNILDQEFSCSICNEIFIEPSVLDCGHTYCNTCIIQARRANHDCPICRQFNAQKPVKHVEMRNFITKFFSLVPMADVQEGRVQLIRERNAATVSPPANPLANPIVPELPSSSAALPQIVSPSRDGSPLLDVADYLRNARESRGGRSAEYSRRLYERISASHSRERDNNNSLALVHTSRPRSALIADLESQRLAAATASARLRARRMQQLLPTSSTGSTSLSAAAAAGPTPWDSTRPDDTDFLLERIQRQHRELDLQQGRIRSAIAASQADSSRELRRAHTRNLNAATNEMNILEADTLNTLNELRDARHPLPPPSPEVEIREEPAPAPTVAGTAGSEIVQASTLFERIQRSINSTRAIAAREERERDRRASFRCRALASANNNRGEGRSMSVGVADAAGPSGSANVATSSGTASSVVVVAPSGLRHSESAAAGDRSDRLRRNAMRRYEVDYMNRDQPPDTRRFYRRLLDYPRSDRPSRRHLHETLDEEIPTRLAHSSSAPTRVSQAPPSDRAPSSRARRLTNWISSDSESDEDSVQVLGSDADVLLSD